MSASEWAAVLKLADTWSEDVRRNFMSRLQAGGRLFRSKRMRRIARRCNW